MRVTMLLADAAQEVNGKLYVLGGGWSVTGPDLPPMAIAIKLDVPWRQSVTSHTFDIQLSHVDRHVYDRARAWFLSGHRRLTGPGL